MNQNEYFKRRRFIICPQILSRLVCVQHWLWYLLEDQQGSLSLARFSDLIRVLSFNHSLLILKDEPVLILSILC